MESDFWKKIWIYIYSYISVTHLSPTETENMRKTSSQRWFNVEPASETLDKHWISVEPQSHAKKPRSTVFFHYIAPVSVPVVNLKICFQSWNTDNVWTYISQITYIFSHLKLCIAVARGVKAQVHATGHSHARWGYKGGWDGPWIPLMSYCSPDIASSCRLIWDMFFYLDRFPL